MSTQLTIIEGAHEDCRAASANETVQRLAEPAAAPRLKPLAVAVPALGSVAAPLVKLVRVPSSANGRAMTQDSAQRFGNYVLEERLAIGGMAEVFRARRVGAAGFSRTVCIKRILPTFCQDKPFVEMFIDEANTGAQLRHSNIVAIDDFGEVDGRYFLAMEFIQGVDASKLLAALAADRRSLPWEVGAFMLREVLSALDYAHRKKAPDGGPLSVVHRDVSPHNVLVSTAGEIKLTDFGIARARTRIHQTSAHVVKGKLAYMAPEQARAQPLDGRADLFAAGVSAFEWLANQRPFVGKNEPEMVSNLLKGRRARLSSLRPDVPDALEAVIDGLLETDRNRRIESASAALALLDPLVSPSAGRLLAAIVAHYFFPHAAVSSVRGAVAFSAASLPPSPLVGASSPPIAPAPEAAPAASPSSPPAPRLSINAPAAAPREPSAATQLSTPAQPSQPSYPSLSEGTDAAVSSSAIASEGLAPRDGSTAVSAVIEASAEKTESRPMGVSPSSATVSAAAVAVRPQDAVTRTSMGPVVDEASMSVEPVVAVVRSDTTEPSSTRAAVSERRPSRWLVLSIAALALVAAVLLVALRSRGGRAVSVRPTGAERRIERAIPAVPSAVPAHEERGASAPAAVVASAVVPPAVVAAAVAEQPAAALVAPQPLNVRERPRARRALRSAAPARAASPARNAVGTLAIQASPWAELTIDGAREGLTPVYRRIAAGTHRIVLVHPPTGRRATRSVRVTEGAVTRLTVELQ